MKKRLLQLLLCVSAILCISCGKKTISGKYKISKLVYQGLSLTLDGGFEKSTLEFDKQNDNIYCTFWFWLGEDINTQADLIMGYIQDVGSTDEYTKYKYWITSSTGNVIQNADYLYMYYYPKDDTIRIDGESQLELYFSK